MVCGRGGGGGGRLWGGCCWAVLGMLFSVVVFVFVFGLVFVCLFVVVLICFVLFCFGFCCFFLWFVFCLFLLFFVFFLGGGGLSVPAICQCISGTDLLKQSLSTEVEVADHTFYLTLSPYTDTVQTVPMLTV